MTISHMEPKKSMRKSFIFIFFLVASNAFSQDVNKESNSAKYYPVSIADLKVDIKDMRRKRVVVSALMQNIGNILMLKSEELDMNPIFADADKLSRDDRKKIANECQLSLCNGRFYGVVKELPIGLGIYIEHVKWM